MKTPILPPRNPFLHDTPETDFEWELLSCSGMSWYVIAETLKLKCRKIERDRNEARKVAEDYRDASYSSTWHKPKMKCPWE
jgi:hypothetical protein